MNGGILDDIDVDVNHFNTLYPDFTALSSQYYDVEKFNAQNICEYDFKIMHLNIRSLNANYDLFHAYNNSFNITFDAMCFSESWLTDCSKNLFAFDNYCAFHSLRPAGRRGGGISVYVLKCYEVRVITKCSLSTPLVESLFLELRRGSKKIMLATVYKPPCAKNGEFLDALMGLLSEFQIGGFDEFILCGDFNIDLLNIVEDENANQLLDALSTLSLLPIITKPTRIANESHTLIDNIFINKPNLIQSGILLSDISDHFPIFLIHKYFFHPGENSSKVQIKFRLINDVTLSNLYNKVAHADYGDIVDDDDCDRGLSIFVEGLTDAYNVCCPIKTKTISIKDKLKPYINESIKIDIKKRNAYWVLLNQKKIPKAFYTNFRNFVTDQIRTSKSIYYANKFIEFKDDIKKTWSLINKIIQPDSSTKPNLVKSIIHNNVVHDDNIGISNAFNEYFSSVGSRISNSFNSNFDDHRKYLSDVNISHSFFFAPVSTREIELIINAMKGKTGDINSLSSKIIKLLSPLISPILVTLINKSLESGVFPGILKVAKVVPLPKGGDKSQISNYRPISILPVISKIYEKVVYRRLYRFLENNNILYSQQYGFRSGRSTTQAIINHLQFIYNSIDAGSSVFSVFLDFKKAFDSVNHDILLSKLNIYGVRGIALDWFQSYLCQRNQYVFVNGVSSDCLNISCGVPQGSILCPLLFLIFINDIHRSSKFFNFTLFADDSTLSTCIEDSNLVAVSDTINVELSNVYSWLSSNRIMINAEKTKYMIFSYKRKINLSPITIGCETISQTDHTRFLGVVLDEHLTFSYHIQNLSRKLARTVGLLYKLNRFIPREILIILYNSFFLPYLAYGLEAWFATYKNHSTKIVVMQKRCVRAINKLHYRSHTNEYFKNLSILKLEDLFKFKVAIYMHNSIYNDSDPCLLNALQLQSSRHIYETRNSNIFYLPFCTRQKSKFNIQYTGPLIWNSIPRDLYLDRSLKLFKLKLRDYYLSTY